MGSSFMHKELSADKKKYTITDEHVSSQFENRLYHIDIQKTYWRDDQKPLTKQDLQNCLALFNDRI